MRHAWAGHLLLGVVTLCIAGCASVDPRTDYARVDRHVAEAVGQTVDRPQDGLTLDVLVATMVADGLTAEEALQVCLLNNPRVRVALLRVGVARAELVQSGLFQNPALSLLPLFPDGGGLMYFEFDFAQNIADLWLLPVRKRAAEGELERTILDVSREVSVAALETRGAYFNAIGLEQERAIAEENRGIAQQLLDAALARQQAGSVSSIDVNLARSELMQTEIALQTTALAALEGHRRLATLLGLKVWPGRIKLSGSLPAPGPWSIDQDRLLPLAQVRRLDLRAADRVVEVAAARVRQQELSVISNVEVSVNMQRQQRGRRGDRPLLADTLWASAQAGALTAPSLQPREKQPMDTIVGPTLRMELPLFDQNQAQIAKAQITYEQAMFARDALMLDVTQEAIGAYQRARIASNVARYYRDTFLPLLESNLALAREAYRGGKISLLSVLESQKLLLASRGRYIGALRDAAVALTELENALGAPLESLAAPEYSPTSMPTSQPSEAKVRG